MKKVIFLTLILCLAALAVGLVACDKVSVVQVEIADQPAKTSYYEGEALDLTGCTLHVVYSNNEVKTVEVTSDMASALDTTGVGPRSVTITYKEGGVSYSVVLPLRVVSRPATALFVAKSPDRTTFVVGQMVDIEGLQVEVYYTDTQRHVVGVADLSYVPVVAELGMTSVRVGLGNLVLDVPIEVVPVSVVGIEATLLEPNIYRNQVLAPYLFNVQYVCNNGDLTPASDWTLGELGTRVETLGKHTLHLAATHPQYGRFECTVEVEAVEDAVDVATLAAAPMMYAVGDAFLWQDIELSVDFAHSYGVSYVLGRDDYADLTADIADGAVFEEAGARTVTVSVGERVVCTFRIAVDVVAPVRWRVEQGADAIVHCSEGETPIPTTLILYAVMSDGTEREVWHNFAAPAGVTVVEPAPAEWGQQRATLVYEGLVYTYRVTVSR